MTRAERNACYEGTQRNAQKAFMFTQNFDNVMLPPKSHILGTPPIATARRGGTQPDSPLTFSFQLSALILRTSMGLLAPMRNNNSG